MHHQNLPVLMFSVLLELFLFPLGQTLGLLAAIRSSHSPWDPWTQGSSRKIQLHHCLKLLKSSLCQSLQKQGPCKGASQCW